MALELIAPAKLNLTLEVLGRRQDGYHDIASVMQTVDLADAVRLDPSGSLELAVEGEALLGVPLEGPRNLAFRAALAIREEAGRPELGARILLVKRIPAGMGLGGGSSDAAAVLRGLNRLWGLNFEVEALTRLATRVGADVAFFLRGGTALVSGRGEAVEPLPDHEPLRFTLFVSDIETEDKTRRMYASLTPSDFTDGRHTHVTAETLRRGLPLTELDLVNAFDRHIGEIAAPMAHAMALCRDAGLAVFTSGSGPGFFTITPRAELPALLLTEIEQEWDVRAIACGSLSHSEALVLRVV